jgi:hypothetical protein
MQGCRLLGLAGAPNWAFALNMSTSSLVAAQVEDEMRELLSVMEQQKVASAAKVKQLATILQDMQAPGMQ